MERTDIIHFVKLRQKGQLKSSQGMVTNWSLEVLRLKPLTRVQVRKVEVREVRRVTIH